MNWSKLLPTFLYTMFVDIPTPSSNVYLDTMVSPALRSDPMATELFRAPLANADDDQADVESDDLIDVDQDQTPHATSTPSTASPSTQDTLKSNTTHLIDTTRPFYLIKESDTDSIVLKKSYGSALRYVKRRQYEILNTISDWRYTFNWQDSRHRKYNNHQMFTLWFYERNSVLATSRIAHQISVERIVVKHI